MVCIPCILAPIGLWIWFRFLYPLVSKFLNFRKPTAIDKSTIVNDKLLSDGQIDMSGDSKEKIGNYQNSVSSDIDKEVPISNDSCQEVDKKNL